MVIRINRVPSKYISDLVLLCQSSKIYTYIIYVDVVYVFCYISSYLNFESSFWLQVYAKVINIKYENLSIFHTGISSSLLIQNLLLSESFISWVILFNINKVYTQQLPFSTCCLLKAQKPRKLNILGFNWDLQLIGTLLGLGLWD